MYILFLFLKSDIKKLIIESVQKKKVYHIKIMDKEVNVLWIKATFMQEAKGRTDNFAISAILGKTAWLQSHQTNHSTINALTPDLM